MKAVTTGNSSPKDHIAKYIVSDKTQASQAFQVFTSTSWLCKMVVDNI